MRRAAGQLTERRADCAADGHGGQARAWQQGDVGLRHTRDAVPIRFSWLVTGRPRWMRLGACALSADVGPFLARLRPSIRLTLESLPVRVHPGCRRERVYWCLRFPGLCGSARLSVRRVVREGARRAGLISAVRGNRCSQGPGHGGGAAARGRGRGRAGGIPGSASSARSAGCCGRWPAGSGRSVLLMWRWRRPGSTRCRCSARCWSREASGRCWCAAPRMSRTSRAVRQTC